VLDPNGIEVERLDRKDCIANFILRPNIIFYDPTSNLEQQKRVKLLAFIRLLDSFSPSIRSAVESLNLGAR